MNKEQTPLPEDNPNNIELDKKEPVVGDSTLTQAARDRNAHYLTEMTQAIEESRRNREAMKLPDILYTFQIVHSPERPLMTREAICEHPTINLETGKPIDSSIRKRNELFGNNPSTP